MSDAYKVDLLVNIARYYYEHNLSQHEIAKKTGFSRPYVSKLINKARECGIVEIKINDPNGAESHVERELRQKFYLHKAIVVPSPNNHGEGLQDKLAAAVSRYLNTIVRDNDIIGVSWGTTLYACSRNLKPLEELKNIIIVQLCGAVSMTEKNIYASEIPNNFSAAYKGIPYLLPLPAVVDNVKTKNAILKDRNLSNVLEMGRKADIAVFSVGTFGQDSTLPRAGYINRDEVENMIRKGAVGDICSRIINIEGKIFDTELNQRTIGIELEDLLKKRYRVGVAGGLAKAKSIYAALAGGYPNIFITDEETALELLRIHDNAK